MSLSVLRDRWQKRTVTVPDSGRQCLVDEYLSFNGSIHVLRIVCGTRGAARLVNVYPQHTSLYVCHSWLYTCTLKTVIHGFSEELTQRCFSQCETAMIKNQPVPMHTLAVSASSTPTCVVLQARTLSFMALYMYCAC
jgi:hypothetical protein